MSNIVYKPYVFNIKITGNTNIYYNSSIEIENNININKGCVFNIAYFDRNIITKNDIIDNLIDYLDDINKFSINVVIVDINNEYDELNITGLYCIKIYYNDFEDYFLLDIINDLSNHNSIILYNEYCGFNNITTTLTTTIILEPIIYYNICSTEIWNGGNLIIPYDVKLNLIHDEHIGWTGNQLINLFINHIYDYYNSNIDNNSIQVKIYHKGSYLLLNEISEIGYYDIVFYYNNSFGHSIVNTINNINVTDNLIQLYYKNNILNNITGNTNFYTGITDQIQTDIFISSGVTFNLNGFDNNIITKYDIVNNIIDYIDNNIDKYSLDILIVDFDNIYQEISSVGIYCIKIYNNEYLILNVIYDVFKPPVIYYNDYIFYNNILTTTTTTKINTPIIYYNLSTHEKWNGGNSIIPYNVYLHLIHDEYSGWTLNQLRDLFINHIYDYYNINVSIDNVNVKLFQSGSLIIQNNIMFPGIYNVEFSYLDSFNNYVSNNINDINVIQNSPTIYYKDYILSKYLTGFTNSYTGITNQIQSDVFISSGFTFNLNGFDKYTIYKTDIIDYLIEYIRDDSNNIIDKYVSNITIAKETIYNIQNIYENVINPGIYCVEVIVEDVFNNKNIKYFIMKVVWDVSVYSEGFWQDNKVWVDFVNWIDHPTIINR